MYNDEDVKIVAERMFKKYGNSAVDVAAGYALNCDINADRIFWDNVIGKLAELKPSCMPIHYHVMNYLS